LLNEVVGNMPGNMPAPNQDRGGYLTAQEVAGIFHVGPKTVTRWAKQGKLPFMRTLGGHRRYSAEVIQALARELETEGEYPAATA
jgi:excisionase family DNA binding protein